jgi:DNA invertase Pin-like site-specific DNA recombinase
MLCKTAKSEMARIPAADAILDRAFGKPPQARMAKMSKGRPSPLRWILSSPVTTSQAEFDMVMAWSVDRLGRSLQDLVGFLSELHALKIDLFLRQQGLDTTTPAGKAMFQMVGVFAEFERAMIAERVRAGLARARSEGRRLGGWSRSRPAPQVAFHA